MISVGAFVSTAGGIDKAIGRADLLGIKDMMVFTTSPRSFQRRVISDEVAEEFKRAFHDADFRSLWIHGSYLMNFGTTDPVALDKATKILIADMTDAARLGAKGVIFHIGSRGTRGFSEVRGQLIETFGKVLLATPRESWLIFENAAGQAIGGRLEELGELAHSLDDDRVKVCLDTQHAFAAGYPVHTQEGLGQMLHDFERLIGRDRLVVLHANDSKVPFSSGRDRHENIGQGQIGEAGFRVITQHVSLQNLPFILEVPGQDGKGPDVINVDRLRQLSTS